MDALHGRVVQCGLLERRIHPVDGRCHLGLYPTVISQCSSTTLYHASCHTSRLSFSKATIGFIVRPPLFGVNLKSIGLAQNFQVAAQQSDWENP
jgi:hypothetical protein